MTYLLLRHNTLQKGAGVLAVSLILLAGAALMLLFAQRNLLVDFRITQNGYGHRLAYAAAESGLGVALDRLNDPVLRNQILVDRKGSGTYDTIIQPEIQVSLGDALNASIRIKALALGGSDVRLQLQSTGCVAACNQGRAAISQMLAMRGGIHRLPFSLISARGDIAVNGAVSLINQTASARGMLFHAGKAIAYDDAVQRTTIPGQQADAAVLANDKSYAQLSADRFFESWFGADKTLVKKASTVIKCNGDCSSEIAAAGSRVIWLEGNARLSSGVLGTFTSPVVIIAGGGLQISGSTRISGVVYSMAPMTEVQLISGRLDGALIAENNLLVQGGGIFTYHPTVLQAAQTRLGTFVPVPGSWSDGE
jgi:hypothetical protein